MYVYVYSPFYEAANLHTTLSLVTAPRLCNCHCMDQLWVIGELISAKHTSYNLSTSHAVLDHCLNTRIAFHFEHENSAITHTNKY